MKKLLVAVLAALTFAAAFVPQDAAAGHRRHHHNGAPIIAGVAAGLLGAAIIGSAIAGQNRRYEPAPVYGHPGRAYYAQPQGQYYEEDEVVVRQPRCFIKRQPLYDEYGQVAAYQNRRVCR